MVKLKKQNKLRIFLELSSLFCFLFVGAVTTSYFLTIWIVGLFEDVPFVMVYIKFLCILMVILGIWLAHFIVYGKQR